MSKLRKEIKKDLLNINLQLNVLPISAIKGSGLNLRMDSFEILKSRKGNEFIKFDATIEGKKYSFFSNLLQAIIIKKDAVEKLHEEGEKIEGVKDALIFKEVEGEQRLHEKVTKSSDNDDSLFVDFEDVETFRIVGASAYYRKDASGKELEKHPAIPLSNYVEYADALKAAQEDDPKATYVTFDALMAFNENRLPTLKEGVDKNDPEMWSATLLISSDLLG